LIKRIIIKQIKTVSMKQALKSRLQQHVSRLLQSLTVLLTMAVFPALSYGQTPPPPTGGSGGGSLPDSPLGVPFDNKLSLLLLAAGVVLAVVKLRKARKLHVKDS
jgi:hypothetical protein